MLECTLGDMAATPSMVSNHTEAYTLVYSPDL